MPDEGLQEIQLRGKQLVFLAMSATVVAVVIFLCGVMVGRGVPTARQAGTEPIEADVLTPVGDPEAPATTADALESTGAVPDAARVPRPRQRPAIRRQAAQAIARGAAVRRRERGRPS